MEIVPSKILSRLKTTAASISISRVIRSKWFVLFVLLVIAGTYGHVQFRRFVLLPEDDSVFRVEYFSLGGDGEKPFYQTETDLELMRDLERMKNQSAFSFLAGCYYDIYKKRFAHGALLTQYVRVNDNQYPDIYEMVKDAAEVLKVDPVPRVFIGRELGTEMIITNAQNPSILIASEFLWAFTPDELRFLLASAVGHVSCNHVFLLDMIKGGQAIMNAAVPDFISRLLIGGIGIKLMNWYREAQISADCAGLVVTGNIDVATNALVKLNIGSNIDAQYGKINAQEYIKQLDDFGDDPLRSASATMSELKNPNPFVTMRVRHLLKWYDTNSYLFQ